MNPVISVEFHAKDGDNEFEEESVSLHGTGELLDFIAPGSGCERIPDEVGEIRMVFLPPEDTEPAGPVARVPATLQLGIVVFYGPLAEIAHAAREILERADRGAVSPSFLAVIGAAH